MGLPTLRLRGDYLAIVTLGFGEILRVLLTQTTPVLDDYDAFSTAEWPDIFPPPVGGSQGFSGITGIPKYTNLFWVWLFVGVAWVIALRVKYSAAGRAMFAVREDEIAAQAMGVNLTRTKVGAFVLSAFLAGIAGGLFAHESGVLLRPTDAGFQRSFEVVILVVLGGLGSVSGVTVAAIVLTLLPEWLRDFVQWLAGKFWETPPEWAGNLDKYRMLLYAAMLIVTMLLRPQGLLGTREIWDWFSRPRKL